MSALFPCLVALLLVGFLLFWWWLDRRRSHEVSNDKGRRDVHESVTSRSSDRN